MKEYRIVTITNKNCSFHIDMEIPITDKAEKILKDVGELLTEYDPAHFELLTISGFYSPRLDKKLNINDTFESSGIWDGDYIVLI